ncbi:MAG: hypothetical protein NTX49_01365 [Chlamydiae bacterium]|nr:hypothetical protein [Chlamydiota bacterium]
MKWICLLLFPLALFADNALPRKIIGFWDSIIDKTPEDSLIHRTLEMPLNHLGIDVIYYDIQAPLPNVTGEGDILGILLCFQGATKMKNPKAFIEWAIQAINCGKKVIIMENPGFLADLKGVYTSGDLQNRLYEKIGFTNTQKWLAYPYDYEVLSESNNLLAFERKYPRLLDGFYKTRVLEGRAQSYLQVGIKGKEETLSDLLIIGESGAFVSQGYGNNYLSASIPRAIGWYINPFAFFEKVFSLAGRPIPDTTTMAGRRIFHATCHGDNWNTETAIEEYQAEEVYCSEVILEKVILPHPDLPISVGVVAADVDPDWAERKKSRALVKRYFALPQVTASSHTYSHPFYWEFFREGGSEKEISYLYLYPYGSWQSSFMSWAHAKSFALLHPKESKEKKLKWGYVIPRAYASEPFSLDKEISGSIDYLNQFALPDDKIPLLIWSGDSRPWSAALELCHKAHVTQFGGGFVRFDHDFPSNLFVYPVGRKPGGWIQIYASANAENAYTDNWSGNFFAFQYLPITYQNTESPRRIKPMHLYFHSFSGQFLASVNAINQNLTYIKSQDPIAIQTTRYCSIGEGFYSVEIEPTAEHAWKIKNRKGLQTIRFDHAGSKGIDYAKSEGIVGSKTYQDSLYVYLDAASDAPIIALQEGSLCAQPYLIDSSWEIYQLQREGESLFFTASGWGALSMRWKMPVDGTYSISSSSLHETLSSQTKDGILSIELISPFNTPIEITIKRGGL